MWPTQGNVRYQKKDYSLIEDFGAYILAAIMSYFQRRIWGALIPVTRILRAKQIQNNQHAETQPKPACRKHCAVGIFAILYHTFLYRSQIPCSGFLAKLFFICYHQSTNTSLANLSDNLFFF